MKNENEVVVWLICESQFKVGRIVYLPLLLFEPDFYETFGYHIGK